MKKTSGVFVFKKTSISVEHVNVIMRKRGFFTYSEMFRALLRAEYERLTKDPQVHTI